MFNLRFFFSIYLIALNFFVFTNIKSYIVSANVLEHKVTNQKIVIYGDTHGECENIKIDREVTLKQAKIIGKKIKQAIKKAEQINHKISILYESIVPEWRLNLLKKNMIGFLIYLTELDNSLKSTAIRNIDNRNYIHSYKECLDNRFTLNNIEERLKIETEPNEIEKLEKAKEAIIEELNSLPLGDKDLQTIYKMYLDERRLCFDNLEIKLNEIKNKISDDLLDTFNLFKSACLNANLETDYVAETSRTAPYLDIDALIYILSNPTNTIILFVGDRHAGGISDLLQKFDYEKIYSFKPNILTSKDEISTMGWLGVEGIWDERDNTFKNSYRYLDLDDLIPDFEYIVKYVK